MLMRMFFIFFVLGLFAVMPHKARAEDEAQSAPYIAPIKSLSEKTESEECIPKKLPPWPLLEIKREEKEVRLRFFLDLYDWKVDPWEGLGNEELCEPIFSKLKSFDEHVSFLDVTNKMASLSSCKNIQDVTLYGNFSWDRSPALKPDEDWAEKLTVAEKEEKSDFFLRPTSKQYTEYYDLSKYFGDHTYGMLAETARHYHPRHQKKLCLPAWNAYAQGGDLKRVFNTDTCNSYFIPLSGASRITADGDWHEATPDFSAFIEIDKKPYYLSFSAGTGWSEFRNILKGEHVHPVLMVIPLQNPKDVSKPVPATVGCAYGLPNKKRKIIQLK